MLTLHLQLPSLVGFLSITPKFNKFIFCNSLVVNVNKHFPEQDINNIPKGHYGIDNSSVLHSVLYQLDAAREFDTCDEQSGHVPVTGVLKYYKQYLKQIKSLNITPVFIFDGLGHPMKSHEEEKRIKRINDVVKK